MDIFALFTVEAVYKIVSLAESQLSTEFEKVVDSPSLSPSELVQQQFLLLFQIELEI